MKPYQVIPVETARKIAREFDKQIVIICAWNHDHKLLHMVTYGDSPQDKISAANGGDTVTKALGMDLSKADVSEDFRTVDAAKNAQLRDLCEGVIHCLRSYEFENVEPGPAKMFADKLEAIIKA